MSQDLCASTSLNKVTEEMVEIESRWFKLHQTFSARLETDSTSDDMTITPERETKCYDLVNASEGIPTHIFNESCIMNGKYNYNTKIPILSLLCLECLDKTNIMNDSCIVAKELALLKESNQIMEQRMKCIQGK